MRDRGLDRPARQSRARGQISLAERTPDGHEDRIGSFFNGSFACDDVEHTWRRMADKGVVFEGPPETQPWGTFARFRDPDGNTFILTSRPARA